MNLSVLQKGRDLLAGGYCLYAATTLLVLALKGKGTHVFALDPAVGDFVLNRANVQIPPRGAFPLFCAVIIIIKPIDRQTN